MTDIFVFGTLCHRPLLDVVAGEAVEVISAHLPDHAVHWVEGKPWPVLVRAPGAMADGFLVSVTDKALARLDFYEACYDYHRQPARIETPDGPRDVEVWRPKVPQGLPGAPWSTEAWAEVWGPLTVLAAEEVMRQAAQHPPAEVGARMWMIRARAQSKLRAASWDRANLIGQGLRSKDVDVVERAHPYDKFFGVEELSVQPKQFDGSQSTPQSRAVFLVADAVTVLPYDPGRDRILMVEQLRLGAYVQGDPHPWLLEPIAGMIDAGESEAESARREAQEEAGIALGELHFVSRYYPSPGGIAQVLSSYIAIADLPDGIEGTHGEEDEGEDIRTHVISFEEAENLLARGDMVNAPMVLSFQWLQLNRTRLRGAA